MNTIRNWLLAGAMAAGLGATAAQADPAGAAAASLAPMASTTLSLDATNGQVAQTTPFAEGSWSFQTYGWTRFAADEGPMYGMNIGVGYFFVDDLSINLEAVGAFGTVHGNNNVNSDSPTEGGGLSLLFRWHMIQCGDLGFFADAGAGMLLTGLSYPADGTHFNFTPQVGLGVTYRIDQDLNLILGGRWHHISNANLHGEDNNPGSDGAMVYAGLMLSF